MADVKAIDIDGEQWNIKDQEARNKIITLEETVSTQSLSDIQVKLKNGYTCKSITVNNHYKVGKVHFAYIRIEDLSGDGVGTTSTITIAVLNIIAIKQTSFILRDYRKQTTARGFIDTDGSIGLGESNGIEQGKNVIMGELIFAEP